LLDPKVILVVVYFSLPLSRLLVIQEAQAVGQVEHADVD
jgi:hypothetical protein